MKKDYWETFWRVVLGGLKLFAVWGGMIAAFYWCFVLWKHEHHAETVVVGVVTFLVYCFYQAWEIER